MCIYQLGMCGDRYGACAVHSWFIRMGMWSFVYVGDGGLSACVTSKHDEGSDGFEQLGSM